MSITRDQIPNSFIIENLPEYYEVTELLELFEGGASVVSHSTHTDPNMVAVVTEKPKDVENALIFDQYEVEPEDDDFEAYEISLRKFESKDLRFFGATENEWEKLGESVGSKISETAPPKKTEISETPAQETTEEIVETSPIEKIAETESVQDSDITEEDSQVEETVEVPEPEVVEEKVEVPVEETAEIIEEKVETPPVVEETVPERVII